MSDAANESLAEGGYVRWEHPLRPLRIFMAQSVLKTLSGEALRWLLTKPSAEIGGILRGTFCKEGGDSVRIEEAEFVFSENAFYNNTTADRERLSEALTRKHARGLQTVGYFRSHIREGLALSAEDSKLIEGELPEPNSVFLLIRPYELGICMAAFFFWDKGRLQTDASDLEVPFVALGNPDGVATLKPVQRSELLEGQERLERPETEFATVPVGTPGSMRMPLPSGPAPSDRAHAEDVATASAPGKRGRVRSFALTLVAAATLGIGTGLISYLALNGWHFQPDLRQGVHLRATRIAGEQIRLTWDGNAPALRHASSGMLTIQDGAEHREIVLDRALLRSGRLPYFAESNAVEFRLDVPPAALSSAPPGVSESVLVSMPPSQKAAEFIPPRPITKVMPKPTLLEAAAFAAGLRVRVEVDVDEKGVVTGARVLADGTSASAVLRSSALAAARRWTFEPATLAGKPVAAIHTILFEFTPPQ